jgi:hypothetical protein
MKTYFSRRKLDLSLFRNTYTINHQLVGMRECVRVRVCVAVLELKKGKGGTS